jgi:hypothetical protein
LLNLELANHVPLIATPAPPPPHALLVTLATMLLVGHVLFVILSASQDHAHLLPQDAHHAKQDILLHQELAHHALLSAPSAHPPQHAPHVTPTIISHPPLVHVFPVQPTVLLAHAFPPPPQDVLSVTQDSILVAPIPAHHVMPSVHQDPVKEPPQDVPYAIQALLLSLVLARHAPLIA